ncbi:MAG: DUF6020 family protein [Lachnospiraceae bacterium]|nr:DUF6020 family protein [Lachnospiraceae bacterium]
MNRLKNLMDFSAKKVISTTIISLIMAVLYFVCIHFRDFNTIAGMYATFGTVLRYFVKICILTVILFISINIIRIIFNLIGRRSSGYTNSNRFCLIFFFAAWCFTILCYLPWLLGTYPGSGNPDTETQFKYYLGELPWSMWHPPLSSLLMGWLYSFGKTVVSANFGFFLYQLFQTVLAGAVYSYAMYKLLKLGIPKLGAFLGILFYALPPILGGYAAWVEKDFLFAVMLLLQTVLMSEVLYKKEASITNCLVLFVVSGLCAFLRNNGIYAIIPALIVLGFYLKKKMRLRILVTTIAVFAVYMCTTKIILPTAGVTATSISEVIGVTFQQTARFVNTYPEEVTPEEVAVIEENFQSYDKMQNYDPTFSDPIKIYYIATDNKAYFKVWLSLFRKHPLTFVASYVNGAYGYLAPVKQDTGAYIFEDYSGFFSEKLELSSGVSAQTRQHFIDTLNKSSYFPLTKYINTPGSYTWIIVIMFLLCCFTKKKESLILFIPAVITILVCTVSPLACAMRYMIPVVLTTPAIVGFTIYSHINGKPQTTD